MSFLSCTKAVHRTLVATTLAALVALGSQAATEAAIIVGLEQVGGPATADGINQTLITARLTIDLNGETAIDAASWAGALSWTVTSGTASVSDLYTVDAAGNPLSTSDALNLFDFANPMLFQSALTSGQLSATMNTTGLDATSQRAIFLADTVSPYPSTTDGIVISEVRFAIAPSVLSATFSVDVLDTSDNGSLYFFGTGPSPAPTVAFTGQAGTLQVVPEPSTMYSLFAVGLVTTGIQVRRLRRRKAA